MYIIEYMELQYILLYEFYYYNTSNPSLPLLLLLQLLPPRLLLSLQRTHRDPDLLTPPRHHRV